MAGLPAEKAVSWRFLLSPHQWIRASAGCACHRTSLEGRGRLCRNRAPATREKSERIQVIIRGNCGFFSLFNLWSRALYLVGAAGQGWNKKSGTVSCSHLMVSKKWWMNWNLAKTVFYWSMSVVLGFHTDLVRFQKVVKEFVLLVQSRQSIWLTKVWEEWSQVVKRFPFFALFLHKCSLYHLMLLSDIVLDLFL